MSAIKTIEDYDWPKEVLRPWSRQKPTVRSFLGMLRFKYLVMPNISRNFALVSLGMWEDVRVSYPLEQRLTGKTVIDVGCDYGNSPLFWRANGAEKVICFEKDPRKIRRLKRMRKMDWLDFRGPWAGETPDGDVFKIDVDGPEALLDVCELNKYATWFVAVHQLRDKMVNTLNMVPALEALGGKVVNVYRDWNGGEVVYKGGWVP